jgi:hypothetical protein
MPWEMTTNLVPASMAGITSLGVALPALQVGIKKPWKPRALADVFSLKG